MSLPINNHFLKRCDQFGSSPLYSWKSSAVLRSTLRYLELQFYELDQGCCDGMVAVKRGLPPSARIGWRDTFDKLQNFAQAHHKTLKFVSWCVLCFAASHFLGCRLRTGGLCPRRSATACKTFLRAKQLAARSSVTSFCSGRQVASRNREEGKRQAQAGTGRHTQAASSQAKGSFETMWPQVIDWPCTMMYNVRKLGKKRRNEARTRCGHPKAPKQLHECLRISHLSVRRLTVHKYSQVRSSCIGSRSV